MCRESGCLMCDCWEDFSLSPPLWVLSSQLQSDPHFWSAQTHTQGLMASGCIFWVCYKNSRRSLHVVSLSRAGGRSVPRVGAGGSQIRGGHRPRRAL